MCHIFKLWSEIAIAATIRVLNCGRECSHDYSCCSHDYSCCNCRYYGYRDVYCIGCVMNFFLFILQLGIELIVTYCNLDAACCSLDAITLWSIYVNQCHTTIAVWCNPQFETMATILLVWYPLQLYCNDNYGRISYIFPQFSISQRNYNRNLKPWYVLILNKQT